jgi:tRNA(fMet)-specific endonuclease VapC
MAASYLLDTNVYCQPIRPQPLASVMQRLERVSDQHVSISIISELEILFGIRRKKAFKQQSSYENLLKDRYPVFDVDHEVMTTAIEIKLQREARGKPISPFDLLIAATAKSHNLILATLNSKDFKDIEGLAVEDWSK